MGAHRNSKLHAYSVALEDEAGSNNIPEIDRNIYKRAALETVFASI